VARLVEHDRDEANPVVVSGVPSSTASSAIDPDQRTWPPLLAGVIAALAAFALSAIAFAIPVFALWLTAAEVGPAWDTWTEVAAITGTAWLAGQGLPVSIGGLTVSLLPWGLAVIPALLLFLAGRWTSRVGDLTRPVHLVTVTLAAVVVYAGLAVGVAIWIDDPSAGLGRVIATTGVLTLVAFGVGSMTGAGLTSSVTSALPGWFTRVISGAVVCVGVLIVAAAITVGVSMIANAEQTHRLLMSLTPDLAGFIAIIVLSLGYLPVLIGWAVSYLLGIGFTVSSGAIISPFTSASETALPVFPLLGAIPESPPVGAAALPVIGLIAGVLGGYTLKRRGAGGWSLLAEAAGMIGVATAALWALLAASSGSLGTDLLMNIGPIIGPTLGVAALLWGVGSLIIVIPVLAAGPADPDFVAVDRSKSPAARFGTDDLAGNNDQSGSQHQQEGRLHGQHHP
jgi:hypothetical protein